MNDTANVNNTVKLRQAWQDVQPADYEAHMARIGQAEANAALLKSWLVGNPEAQHIVFAGAGTGQMFDYLSIHEFSGRDLTFTDINDVFLDHLGNRLRRALATDMRVIKDDLLNSQLSGPFDAAVLVLVLEHVDWLAALAAFPRWGCQRVLLVIQENPPHIGGAVSPGAPLGGSMERFRDAAKPHLIPLPQLEAAMAGHGYLLDRLESSTVLDDKRMHACWFINKA